MLTIADTLFFGTTFLLVLGIGLYAGRSEKNSQDYFLGGRSLPWWGVAGSLFGTNVSANHLVGMLGIGFSVGFAQSHYEFGSIPAILLLAFVFLPLFRRQRVYTLSQFLETKFGKEAARVYSGLSLVLILIQLTGSLYIGARSFLPFLKLTGFDFSYAELVLWISITSTIYTWFGGLKSVVYTDVIQTILILISGILLFVLALNRPEVGGFWEMIQREGSRTDGLSKLQLYLPPDHPVLPWTGAFTGLFLLHLFYWNTNQYVVQRTLGAKSLKEARLGILVGGFLKLTIPFFSILTGVAAYQIWNGNDQLLRIDPDETFSHLVVLVVPAGYGIIGIILAGLMGAIFSSIDSMLHSAATLFTIDFYKPLRMKRNLPSNDLEEMRVGRIFLLGLATLVTLLAIFFVDPKSKENFFLVLSNQSSHFTPALLGSFLFGMYGVRIRKSFVLFSFLALPLISITLPFLYQELAPHFLKSIFGDELNFLHRVFFIFLMGIFILYLGKLPSTGKKTFSFGRFFPFFLCFSIGLLALVLCRLWFTEGIWIWGLGACFVSIFSTILYVGKNRQRAAKRILYHYEKWLFGVLLGVTLFFYFVF